VNIWNFSQVCVNLARRNNSAWRNCGKAGVIHWLISKVDVIS
jgi:hypothetical protein